MVLAAAASLQVGAAFAVTLFDELGPGGRGVPAARVRRARAVGDLAAAARRRPALAAAFGVALGLMNWSIYEAMDRIPLGVAVTIEFAGPLLVAVLGSRRPLDGLWIALAAAGHRAARRPGRRVDRRGRRRVRARRRGVLGRLHLLSKRTGAAFPGGSGLAIAMAVGALVVLPAGRGPRRRRAVQPDLLGAALVVALASSVLPYSLELEALRRLPEAVFGVLMSLEPRSRRSPGFVVLGQDLGARELVAIAMVVAASAGARPEPQSPMTTWLAAHRGLRALSARETARVLKLWTQTIAAPILSSALFILVFGLSLGDRIREIDGFPYDQYHRPGPGRDGDGAGRVREQLRERLPGALRPLHQRRARGADARLGGQPRPQPRRRGARAADRRRAAGDRAAAHRRAGARAARARRRARPAARRSSAPSASSSGSTPSRGTNRRSSRTS